MQIKMIQNAVGSANADGNVTREYLKDEIIECHHEWQINLAKAFIEGNLAIETKIVKPTEKKAKSKAKKKVAKKVTKKKTSKKK